MSEDQEWAKRALLAGYKIAYANESVVYHSHDYSLRQVFHRFFGSGATLSYIYRHENMECRKGKFIIEGLIFIKILHMSMFINVFLVFVHENAR